jgi:hypothetical protein
MVTWNRKLQTAKRYSPTNLQFAIQAIDNSFHSGRPCIGERTQGVCYVAAEEISACSQRACCFRITAWRAMVFICQGFLGVGNDFEFSSDVAITIFYYNPLKEGCFKSQSLGDKNK